MGENIYMLPSNMNLSIKTGTAGYNHNILISDGKFSLGKNDKVNTSAKISHKDSKIKRCKVVAQTTATHKSTETNYHP